MSDRNCREREVAAILMASVVGDATDDELARLDAWLREDPALAQLVVEIMQQESWLSWDTSLAAATRDAPAAAGGPYAVTRAAAAEEGRRRYSTSQLAAAAVVVLAVGAMLGGIIAQWRRLPRRDAPLIAVDGPRHGEAAMPYMARFVQGTACLWNPDSEPPAAASGALRMGQTLNLLEGLAEVEFEWDSGSTVAKIEGPASLVLTAERGVSLSRGKITVDAKLDGDMFMLDTPNGLVEVSQNASIGIEVRGDAVEVHVFGGVASFVSPWTGRSVTNDDGERFRIDAGNAITISGDSEGRLRQSIGVANPSRFVSQISMLSDDLLISDEYVESVLADGPLLYWRFDGKQPKVVKNEVAAAYDGRVRGEVKWLTGENGSVELGTGLTPAAVQAYIIAEDPFDRDLSDGYTMEFWVKPSHYHRGTIVGLIDDASGDPKETAHGMLFELGGPIAYPSEIEQPGRFRFLHRSPPGGDPTRGVSCFSPDPYELRSWQHVACVKTAESLVLYVNGQRVSVVEDATSLPAGLQLIVGQLDETRRDRRFTGQIDELAFYPRALEGDALRQRVEMVRTSAQRTAPNRVRRMSVARSI